MLKKTIQYTDYNGIKRTEDFYFNLNRAEVLELELSHQGGISKKMERIVASQSSDEIMQLFKDIVLKAYGEKSDDGKYFRKSKELVDNFTQTEAYSELIMELAFNSDKAAEFMNGIIPAGISEESKKIASQ